MVPAAVTYALVTMIAWYVTGFVVKPNELVRERPYITNNIAHTQAAFLLNGIAEIPFPAEPGLAAIDAATTLEVAVVAPASASMADLKKLALAKLKARIARERREGRIP